MLVNNQNSKQIKLGSGSRIRVEFHVSGFCHTLSGVHLLDPSSQVVPDLVKANLLQSMGILTSV